MIKIAKGNITTMVPKASFDNFFQDNGWVVADGKSVTPATNKIEKPIEEVKEEKVEEPAGKSSTDDEWDEALEEEFEKPISEMSKAELKKKAESLGIDVSTNYTSNQLRDMIREAQN